MGTVELQYDSERYSIDVQELSSVEEQRLAAKAPPELVEMTDADSYEEMDAPANNEDVLEYLITVTTSTTEFTEQELGELPMEPMVKIMVAVLEEVFTGSDDSDTTNRIKRVRATAEFVETLFRGDITLVAGLPDDATLHNFNYDPSRNELQFIFESSEFEPVAEGAEIPLLDVASVDIAYDDPRVKR